MVYYVPGTILSYKDLAVSSCYKCIHEDKCYQFRDKHIATQVVVNALRESTAS